MSAIPSSPGGVRESSIGELTALRAYEWMFRIRVFEERCQSLSDAGVFAGSIHLCAGQEAIPVGVVSLLQRDEPVVATYRGHGWAIACGVPLPQLLAEICHRATGVNGGRGGSPYLSSPEHGLVGENSIVGAGLPIAAGVALASKAADRRKAVVVSIGDGATSQGATHEALVFAAAKRVPLVVVCENNGWSEMTAIRDIVPIENLSERAAGYGIDGVTVDGSDPEAVRSAVQTALLHARAGDGPTFIECKAPRLWGHYNADIEHYRPQDDKASATARDPIGRLRQALIRTGSSEEELLALERDIAAEIDAAEQFARSSPLPDPATARDHVVSDATEQRTDRPLGRTPSTIQAETMSFVQAVNRALEEELANRPELLVFGEDVGVAGGAFGATRTLQKQFGADRVFDTPIAESSILGAAIGLALTGMRPVAEIMWSDFLLVALDQLINQAANVRYLARGTQTLPLVVRTQQGVTPGSCAQHSQSLEALLAHIPGLRVGLPATPQDAYSMLRAAIADEDPCVVIESRALYKLKGEVVSVPDSAIGGARRYGDGRDLAIISWGRFVHLALEAAEAMRADGIESTVLDLRWLSPLDDEALAEVVAACGRVLVLHEANRTGGFGGEIVARIVERHFDDLDAPIKRIAPPDVRFPAAPALQAALLPSTETIVDTARELLAL